MSDVALNEDSGSKDEHSKAKKRFEERMAGIIAEYDKDFRGKGDEISMETGEIVVDNGHLRSMSDKMHDDDVWALPGNNDDWELGSIHWTENALSPQGEAEPDDDDNQDKGRSEGNVATDKNDIESAETDHINKTNDMVQVRAVGKTKRRRLSYDILWLEKTQMEGFCSSAKRRRSSRRRVI
ncbi:centromere protein Scm3 [Fusarium oxysporum f. sp. phaseoli]